MTNYSPYFALQQNGWSLMPHMADSNLLGAIRKKKDNWISEATSAVGAHHRIDLSRFDANNVELLELAKSIVRANIRYDRDVYQLGKAVQRQLNLQVVNSNHTRYATLPYAIIHWPEDQSEKGPMHKDGYYYIKNFHTTWTPLNDCTHRAISIVENSHHEPNFLQRRLKVPAIQNNQSLKNPAVKYGEFLSWYGTTDHEGLLNTTDQPTVAIVYRFTDTPIMLEVTRSSFEGGLHPDESAHTDSHSFNGKMLEIYDWVAHENINRADELYDAIEFCARAEQIVVEWQLSETERHKIACALTLIAQRMEAKKNMAVFYLYALLCSGQMVYPLQQLVGYLLSNTSVVNTEAFMKWIIARYPYQQHAFVLNERMAEWNKSNPHCFISIPTGLSLKEWKV